MEVKVNREIREYTEGVFFGMSLRQCVFALLACVAAVGLYFGLSPFLRPVSYTHLTLPTIA